MGKPSVGFVASLLLNMLLIAWLVEQYLHDVYFQAFVDQNSTFFILAIGVSAGSSAGYLFLRRKGTHLQGLPRTKPLKLDGTIHSPSSMSAQSKAMPAGAPPAPPPKHTAYAVPPISKATTPSTSTQKSSPGSWIATAKQAATMQPSPSPPAQLSSRPPVVQSGETGNMRKSTQYSSESRPTPSGPSTSSMPFPSPRPEFSKPPSPPQPSIQRGDQFAQGRQLGESVREAPQASKWQPEPSQAPERREPAFSSPRAGQGPAIGGSTESALNRVPVQGFGATPQRPPLPQAQSESLPQKWQPLDSNARPPSPPQPSQWVSPVPRQSFNPPPRQGPPGGPGSAQGPSPPGMSPRPGQPGPVRPTFPSGQGPPRPLTLPGMMRPSPPGPSSQGGFRPGTVVTGPQGIVPRNVPPGQSTGPRPSLPTPSIPGEGRSLPPPPLSGPGLGLGTSSKGISSAETKIQESQTSESTSYSLGGSEPAPSGGSEMDWDTALDTILKTLRKDKVGEKTS